MLKNEYHIHVNCYQISQETIDRINDVGLQNDPFTENDDHEYSPKEHFSFYDAQSRHDLDNLYQKVLSILKDDSSFIGYVETETCPLKLKREMKYRPFCGEDAIFPIKKTELEQVPVGTFKACDIHIDRPADCPRDLLDEQLLSVGFYEVHTLASEENKPLERIYTIQTEKVKEAQLIYKALFDYLKMTGGASKIELEYTHDLVRFPEDFRLAPYVTKAASH